MNGQRDSDKTAFRHQNQAASQALGRCPGRHVSAIEGHSTRRTGDEPLQATQGRRLSRTIAAEDRDDITLPDAKTYLPHRMGASVANVKILDLKQQGRLPPLW